MALISKPSFSAPLALAALCIASPAAARTVSIPFDADNFSDPLTIDNAYWPLQPGDSFIYKASTRDGCEEDHVTVTSDTKVITIGGESLTVRVVEDFAYEDGDCDGAEPSELVERTFDWYGQDDSGNIWYFGEQTFDCEGAGNCVLGDGSWEAGKDIQGTGTLAQPGIFMLAAPSSGDSYRQELYPGFAEDWGMAMNLGATVRLRRDDALEPGEWQDCLVTKEWNDLEPGHVEQKSYCPGVGLVLVEEHRGAIVRFELTGDAAASDALIFREAPGS